MSQVELAKRLDKSQGTISLIEQGRDIPNDVKDFYVMEGLNFNWFYTGRGPMVITGEEAKEPNINYESLERDLTTDPDIQDVEDFFLSMRSLEDYFNDIKRADSISDKEKAELIDLICKKIREKQRLLDVRRS